MLAKIKQYNQIQMSAVINYTAVAYAFFLPLSRAGISLFTALIFLLWLMEGNLKEKFLFLKRDKVVLAIIAFIFFCALSLLWSGDRDEGINNLRKFWYLLPILIFATSIKKQYIQYILSSFLFGMLISEILSYGIFFEWWAFEGSSPENPTPFMNHLQYSMFLSLSSLLLLNRFFFEESIKWKIFYFIYFLTVTSNLFLNGGRTGHLAFAISIFVVGFANIKNKILAFTSMLILVTVIFFTAYYVSPVFKMRFDQGAHEVGKLSQDTKDQYDGSFGYRVAAWKVATEIIPENPILGTGFGDQMNAMKRKVKENNYESGFEEALNFMATYHYHNVYVQFTVTLGIVGLLLYLFIFYQILRLQIQDKEISNLRYIFLSVFMISSMVEMMFSPQFPMAFFALFTGLFIGFAQHNGENKG